MKKKKILVIVAHPDDEILGCGGSIIKFSKNSIIKTVFTCKTHDTRNNIKNSDDNEKRQIIAKKVAKYLKITKPTFLNYPGLKMSRNDTTKMAKSIYDEILKFKPDIILTERVSHFSSYVIKRKMPLIIFLRGDYWKEVEKENSNASNRSRLENIVKKNIAEKCL